MKKKDVTAVASEQVNVRRRGFLGKLLAGGAAFAALPAMSTVVLGENKQKGSGKGKGSQGGPPDPAKMAVELIKRFDKDGDKALNARELAQALTAMRERFRSRQGQGSRGQGQGSKGQRGRGQGSRGQRGRGQRGRGQGRKGQGQGSRGKGNQ